MELFTLSTLFGIICMTYGIWKVFNFGFDDEPKSANHHHHLPLPPGPTQLPVLGNLLQAAAHASLPIYDYFAKLHQKYGKVFRFQAGVTSQVIVSDFELIKEIGTNPNDIWIDRHIDEWLLERSYGKPLGILFSGGDIWKESRRFIMRSLRDAGLGRQTTQEGLIRDELGVLLQRIETTLPKEKADGSRVVNMKNFFTVPILNTLWAMITGERFEHDDPKLKELFGTMEVLIRNYSLAGDIYLAFPKLRHVLPYLTGHGKERRVYEPMMQEMFRNLLETRRTRASATVDGQADYLVDAYIKKQKELMAEEGSIPETYSDDHFTVIAMDLFLAGSETSSNSLEFAFLYMILHPEVQSRVQAEIDAVIGREKSPEYKDLARMPYTEAVLLETMRYSTVVPFVARVPREPVRLGQFRIPKDTMVISNLHAIHFDKEFWGDPNQFRPERFLLEEEETSAPSNDSANRPRICPIKKARTLPFGIGRRQCPGEVLARSSIFIYFVTLLQRYRFEAKEGTPPSLEKRVGLTVAPVPYVAVLKQRDE